MLSAFPTIALSTLLLALMETSSPLSPFGMHGAGVELKAAYRDLGIRAIQGDDGRLFVIDKAGDGRSIAGECLG